MRMRCTASRARRWVTTIHPSPSHCELRWCHRIAIASIPGCVLRVSWIHTRRIRNTHLNDHILMRLSQPPVTSLLVNPALVELLEVEAGAQLTELTPNLWAARMEASQVPSLWKVSTLTLPSELAHARVGPSSWGAQLIELTEEVCRV